MGFSADEKRDHGANDDADYNARYARHFALPEVGRAGQEKLRSARVLLVGAGGLGSPAALYLAAAGVGHLGINDDDVVSLSNLQRQILYTSAQVSQSKVELARRRLLELNPYTRVDAIGSRLDRGNVDELLNHYDLVIDGSDNFSTRYVVNDACVRAKKVLVSGAIYRFEARISVFGGAETPCYACLYPQAPEAEAVPGCTEAGVLGVLPGVAGTLMATEALKVILGIGKTLAGRILIYDALNTDFRCMKLARRKDCRVCGERRAEATVDSLDPDRLREHAISAADLRRSLAEPSPPLLIDVRSEEEFLSGHLPGAKNIPLGRLARSLDTIPTDSALIVVCQSGKRSRRAAEILLSCGRSEIRHLAGGLEDYRA